LKKFKYILLVVSILANVYFLFELGLRKFNEPSGKLGVLKQDTKVRLFDQSGVLFNLPKGITVRDIAPRGIGAIGQFENERFSVVITSDRTDLVDYNVTEKDLQPYSNYYSADFPIMENRENHTKSQYKNGDIIFQTSKSRQSKAIQLATNSKYSHMGIIYENGGKYFVYEAVQPVKLTPLKEWMNRGENGHYVIKRLKNAENILTNEILNKMKLYGDQLKGKSYDIYFEWSDDKIYCSELVWKIYKEAANIEIGKLEQLSDFDLSDKIVQSIMKERYGENIPMDEKVISPAEMFNSDKLETVEEK
jgi:hypothetical protein